MALAPRVVVVHRRSELDEPTQRHATRGQVEFFLEMRGLSLGAVEEADAAADSAVQSVGVSIPHEWRRADVEREDLPRFLFGPEDIVAVVGRDGLVANVAKYVGDQPVVGFNPFPQSNAGVLTPFDPADAAGVLARIGSGRAAMTERTMVQATADDGQEVTGLNDIYIGDQGHQSARYELFAPGGHTETQSSSGLIVGTGTGATRTAAALTAGEQLTLTVKSEVLVVFGDGIEHDAIEVGHGQRIELGIAPRRLRLVQP